MPPKLTGPPQGWQPPTHMNSASLAQQKANSSGISEFELPKSNLTKLAKGSVPDNVKMQQDVTIALLRGSTLFINYLSDAHDQAVSRSGKTITASDVIKAITELDFGPSDALVPLLEQELQAYRNHIQAAKLAKKSAANANKNKGPRKSSGTINDGEGDVEMVDDDDEGEGENDNEEEDEEEDIVEGADETRDGNSLGVGDESEIVHGENEDI
ncbi:hypothetical protein L486_08213 [Kwoniella mangroviensis CBS 10435]|uniref:DNA polymerase epsilon subunit D n=1 Tax=Kwoniella mangroviensis CBS 10435 TaxID=1331196 RepID=A0A1B9IF83_9TREE|nr:hypothetical protein L486_08213 [Kwoniella mangroviensis CBS 10435]